MAAKLYKLFEAFYEQGKIINHIYLPCSLYDKITFDLDSQMLSNRFNVLTLSSQSYFYFNNYFSTVKVEKSDKDVINIDGQDYPILLWDQL